MGQGNHEGCPYGADDGGSPPRPWMPVVTGMTEGVVGVNSTALRAEALDSSLRGSSVQNDSAGNGRVRARATTRVAPTVGMVAGGG